MKLIDKIIKILINFKYKRKPFMTWSWGIDDIHEINIISAEYYNDHYRYGTKEEYYKAEGETNENMNDEKRFCSKCNWNDCDYGCTCPQNEEVYQCEMYMYYHPDEVKEFDKAMEEWMKQKAESDKESEE